MDAIDNVLRHAVCLLFAVLLVQAALGLAEALQPLPAIEYRLAAEVAHKENVSSEDAERMAKQIAAQHLFGAAVAAAPSPPEVKEKKNSPIKLAGIIYGGRTMPSRAILTIQRVQKSYQPGEKLPTGEVLTKVRANKVVLKGPDGPYSLVLRHESDALLAEAPHFGAPTEDGITILEMTGPAPAPSVQPAPPPASIPTLQRLSALRAKLLGGG